ADVDPPSRNSAAVARCADPGRDHDLGAGRVVAQGARGAGGGADLIGCALAAAGLLAEQFGEMAERFKAAVLLAEAASRSEQRRSRWPEGRGAGSPESNWRRAVRSTAGGTTTRRDGRVV